jgi:CelD/BcsL family acetyltransferase involved in cellulose biosynthesis
VKDSFEQQIATASASPVGRSAPAPRERRALQLRRLEIGDPDWRSFVAEQPRALLFHQPEWGRLLADCYGYRAFALAAADASGRIRAGVPVVEVSGPFRKTRWVALPFTDSCDPLVADDVGEAFAHELGRSRASSGISAIEVRGELAGPAFRVEAGTIHRLDLTPGLDALHRGFSKSRVRPEIKRAIREGVTVREATEESDLTTAFYGLHLETRRRQGVPVQPRRFFELLWRRLIEPGLGFALLADLGGRPVAGAVFLDWNGTVIYKYAASDETQRWARPNHLVLWEGIRRSHDAGAHTMDFGRSDSTNEGLRKFKAGWGAEEAPLVYSTFADSPPARRAQRSHRLQTILQSTIRRSPPWVCRAIGTAAYRYVA